MKIAIHQRKGSFSDRWIIYCEENQIPYKIVNCYNSNIVEQLNDCTALMWHFHHASVKDALFAKQLLISVALSGKKVFPDIRTCWHFDDKVGQKYLLESVGAEMVPSHVFYIKKDAFRWIKETTFPKVFKLRGGAGSFNVKLISNKNEAKRFIRRAFRKGFSKYNKWSGFKDTLKKYREEKASIWELIKTSLRFFYTTEYARMLGNESGYIYFQDFIPNNNSDVRVIVIDGKAFAIKRMVRKNDFRASGSGNIHYAKDNFDNETIQLAFSLADKLKVQCVAFDFVYDGNKPLVVELSYGFAMHGYDACPGYWTSDLIWHEGHFNPQGWMVDALL